MSPNIFTIKDGQCFAYLEGQEALYEKRIQEQGHLPLPAADALALLTPPKSLQELADAALAAVNAEYIKRMGAVASPYPLHERESWPIQLAEAQTVLLYPGGELPEGVTSTWIDQCAQQRGLSRLELAQRIVAKDTAYRTVSGFLSGVRQWHEDCVSMLLSLGEEARGELQAYDHLQGWVRTEEQLAA